MPVGQTPCSRLSALCSHTANAASHTHPQFAKKLNKGRNSVFQSRVRFSPFPLASARLWFLISVGFQFVLSLPLLLCPPPPPPTMVRFVAWHPPDALLTTVGMLCLGLSLCPPGSTSWAVPTHAQSAEMVGARTTRVNDSWFSMEWERAKWDSY